MIKVEHLDKTYKTNKTNQTHAIDDISFYLPNTGMIFIVGKSGSGKSTLLNILGGLDDFDSGSVIVDGNDFNKMSHSDFNKYRSDYVSFIFQDHFLIDQLKVKDNVDLSLNIINENNYDKVKDELAKVDLVSKMENFPLELSGGERQRVAVARAIIKNPKLILCDEPTGNLDDKTTKLVFDLLKDLSKDRLVIVVSHDMESARIYADRVIEIYGGKIISDEVKNPNYSDNIKINDDYIIIPDKKVLNEEDINLINKNIAINKQIKIGDKEFINHREKEIAERNIKLEKHRFYHGRINHISKIFIRRRLKKMFITSLIVSLIIACFSIFLSLLSFDGNKEIINKLKKNNTNEIMIRNNAFTTGDEDYVYKYMNKLYSMMPSDLEYYENSDYNGNIFKLYNYSIGYSSTNNNRNETFLAPESNMIYFYMKESYGTLCCNKEYLEKKFGKLNVIKGDIDDPKGVIITDYLADSILYNNLYRNSYDEIIGRYYLNSTKYDYFYISAIIETDYKTKFKDIMDKYDFKASKKKDLTKMISKTEFDEFSKEITSKYGLAYSFSTDFLNDFINIDSIGYIPVRYAHFEYDGVEYYPAPNTSFCSINRTLNHGEVIGNLRYINQIFGTDYTVDNMDTFEPMTIKVKKYYDYTQKASKELVSEVEVKIVSIENFSAAHDFFCREDDYPMFKDICVINYGLIFDDVSSGLEVLENKNVQNYYIDDSNVKAINLIYRYVSVFRKLSVLISVILGITGLIYLVFYEISNISSMKKEIGIFKACGMAQRTISRMFIYQQLIVSAMVAIIATIFSYFLIGFANSLMVTSIDRYANTFINGLVIIKFIPRDILTILALTIIIIMASCTIPILLLIKVKPMNIIKSKE